MTSASATATPSGVSSSSSSIVPEVHLPPSKSTDAEIAKARSIPVSFRESLSSWWASNESDAANSETRLLKQLSFFKLKSEPNTPVTPSNPDPITARIEVTPLSPSTPKRFLNTVAFTTPSTENSKHATVLLHGYGAGLGFFFLNWENLALTSTAAGRRAYAVDWFGMGRSARVDPKELIAKQGKKATVQERVKAAEDFFIDSLDSWREQKGIEKMTLIGHSLGGYLTAAYTLRHPTRVDRLVLLSPAGIPENPNDPTGPSTFSSKTESANAALREVSESQLDTTSGGTGSPSIDIKKLNTNLGADRKSGTISGSMKSIDDSKTLSSSEGSKKGPPTKGRRAQLFEWMWEEGWSPFSVIRGLGPWGPMVVGRYSSRRFAALPEETRDLLHAYIWTISRAKGSSEYCITHLLAPGAHARMPIVNRIDKVKVPVDFVYGDRDWMDPAGGAQSIKNLRKAGNMGGKLFVVEGAGHHVYLDNPEATNKIVRDAIREAAAAEKKAGGSA